MGQFILVNLPNAGAATGTAKTIELRWMAAHNPDNPKLKALVDDTLNPKLLLNGMADFIQTTVSSFQCFSPNVGAFDMPLDPKRGGHFRGLRAET